MCYVGCVTGRSVVVSVRKRPDTVDGSRTFSGRSVVVSRKSGGLEVVGSIPAAPTKTRSQVKCINLSINFAL